jgi:hypothetical protein
MSAYIRAQRVGLVGLMLLGALISGTRVDA